MVKYRYDIEQGSEEWDEIRSKRLTGSHGTAIAANGKGLQTYVLKKIEQLICPSEGFHNAVMDRGNELEPMARMAYEFEKGVEVVECGFIEYGEHAGSSPDGLVGDDGGIEIKARNNAKHLALLLGGPIDTGTVWQIQFNLFVTGRKWWDFVSYNPNFKQSLFVVRILPDVKAHEKIKSGLEAGEILLRDILKNEAVMKELEI